LGFLAYFASPIALIAIAHHVGHGALDRFDPQARARRRGLVPGAESVAAGFFGWFAIVFSTMAAGRAAFALAPPPPDDEALAAMMQIATELSPNATLHTLVWIAIAASLYAVQRRARG